MKKLLALVLCAVMLCSTAAPAAVAADTKTQAVQELVESKTADLFTVFSGLDGDFGDNFMKVLYNMLNVLVERLVRVVCLIYPNPGSWKTLKQFYAGDSGFMSGRDTYQTEKKDGSYWSLGYASRSIIPPDINDTEYYLGRDLLNKKAQGVYDDQRIRVSVVDDNSGEGAVVIAAIDAMGVTSTDIRSIRKQVLAYCEEKGISVAGINIMSTHCHSALDCQGVSTEFFYKLFTAGFYNFVKQEEKTTYLNNANSFKAYFIEQSVIAIEEAFADMTAGTMSFSEIDTSYFVKDKRELVDKEDIPPFAVLKVTPSDASENTYIVNATCHPTSFSANNGVVSSDYIYYLDRYIKENDNGANTVLFQGSLGQLSRDNMDVDETGLSEWERMGAETAYLGETFAGLILAADYGTELEPILNYRAKEIFMSAENSILQLACEVGLVNNQVVYQDIGNATMASEQWYLEFGHKIGFAMFPGELYPEVFWGSDIIDNQSWDGSEWQWKEGLHHSVEGVDVYCISLANDATGYVLTDNNFAFMGHIIGDSISDEVLSAGKHMGSFLVSNYLDLVDGYTK